MKNPRKSSDDTKGTVLAGGVQLVQQDIEDYPFATPKSTGPQETPTPDEESFRALLRDHLPRHTAPQALKDRIKRSIMLLPD